MLPKQLSPKSFSCFCYMFVSGCNGKRRHKLASDPLSCRYTIWRHSLPGYRVGDRKVKMCVSFSVCVSPARKPVISSHRHNGVDKTTWPCLEFRVNITVFATIHPLFWSLNVSLYSFSTHITHPTPHKMKQPKVSFIQNIKLKVWDLRLMFCNFVTSCKHNLS